MENIDDDLELILQLCNSGLKSDTELLKDIKKICIRLIKKIKYEKYIKKRTSILRK